METWKPSWLLKAVLAWTTVTFSPAWFFAMRGLFFGSEFEWKHPFWGGSLSGAGFRGDYFALLLIALCGALILTLAWRGGRMPVHVLLPGWHVFLTVIAIQHARRYPETYDFLGRLAEAQLGWEGFAQKVPWILPAILGLFALLSIVWAMRDFRTVRDRRVTWTAQNEALFWVVIAIFPILLILWRLAPLGADSSDSMASLAAVLQLILVNPAAYPWRPRK